MSRIDELKQEIAELEAQAQAGTQQEHEQQTAEPQDGRVLQPPRTLEELFDSTRPWNVKRAALKATAADESLPLAERTAAAIQWREMLRSGSHWHQFHESELAERLSNHPHSERLKELNAAIEDETLTIRERFAAIDEHKRLRDEYPKREIPYKAFVLHRTGYDDAPGRKLASEVGDVIATAFGKSSSFVTEIVRARRGLDFDCNIANLDQWLRQRPTLLERF